MAGFGSLIVDGLENGARSFGDQTRWVLGGMNGPAPEPYTGGPTANQYVARNWPIAQPHPSDPQQEGGAPTGPDDPLNRPGFIQALAQQAMTPGAAMQANPYPPGSEEAAWYDGHRQTAIANYGPQQAMSMIGTGAPMAVEGALGAAGGRLRNQFTGQWRKEGVTPLPGNPYRAVNTQAKPVAANSAAVVARTGNPLPAAAADPALMENALARMKNPMVEQVPNQLAAAPTMDPAPAISPHDVDYWKSRLSNGFGSLIPR